MKTGAALNRHRSKQDYQTPRAFLEAVERRFGPIVWDLAAHEGNHVAHSWYGPGSESAADSLDPSIRWHRVGNLWLNPPFNDIEPWAQKCKNEMADTSYGKLSFLVPASVGSEWFAQYVWGHSRVLPLRPRLSFDGVNPYPKDCMLCVYGEAPGFEPWRWDR